VTALACTDVALDYPGVRVLAGIDFDIVDGEVVALLGASGSGKTTLIHAVAGFVTPTAGEIRLGGSLVSSPRRCVAPERRRVGMVFQNYALWPNMTALDTVAYPLRRAGIDQRRARERARELLDRVGVGGLAERTPAEMSGGEQQRVGLARALARDAGLYVFDEPSAHLDAHLRMTVLDEFAHQRAVSGAAALYATHDASEALAIADRVAVLHNGRLAQLAAPAEVYARPADLHVAQLTGVARLLTAPIDVAGSGSIVVTVDSVRTTVRCANALLDNGLTPTGTTRDTDDARPAREGRDRESATLLVRPEWAALGGDLPGRVVAVRYHGPDSDHYLETPVGTVIVRSPGTPQLAEGDRTTWSLLRCWRM
jgi:ABC-type Fe3+/spermidine/putrescine transport system ATPase subunit